MRLRALVPYPQYGTGQLHARAPTLVPGPPGGVAEGSIGGGGCENLGGSAASGRGVAGGVGVCEDGHPGGLVALRVAVLVHVLSGGVLLSHEVPLAVPSAQSGLASGFGMGTGRFPDAMTAETLWRSKPTRHPHTPGRGLARGGPV